MLRHATPELVVAFLASLVHVEKDKLEQELRDENKITIRQEIARLQRLSEHERRVEAARLHAEEKLALRCPGCQHMFCSSGGYRVVNVSTSRTAWP
jgi:hypothetical protein